MRACGEIQLEIAPSHNTQNTQKRSRNKKIERNKKLKDTVFVNC